jgi:hypothetical protein
MADLMNSVTNPTEGTLVKGYLTGYCWLNHQASQTLNIEYTNGDFADMNNYKIYRNPLYCLLLFRAGIPKNSLSKLLEIPNLDKHRPKLWEPSLFEVSI